MAVRYALPKPTEPLLDQFGKLSAPWYNYLRTRYGDDAAEEIIASLEAQIADLLARVEALEEGESARIVGPQSVSVVGSLQNGLVQLTLVGDEDRPLPVSFYATDENQEKGWQLLQPDWVPNPYADYLVDENGNYLIDENGNFLTGQDGFPIPLEYGGTGGDYSTVSANLVFASPDGSPGAPVFRSLVVDDIPGVFDPAGAAAAALAAANSYTDDVVPSSVLYCDAINGRVGVGTTSPLFQFHVEGASAGLYLNRTGGPESFIALAIGGTSQGQIRADAGGYLKVANPLGSVELIRLGTDLGVIGGRLFGTALHNNAGGITGTTNQYVGSGTYTPTLTNTANIDASTPQVFQYSRTGNVVTVSGSVNIDPTAATTLTTLGISLPIASDLNSYVQCCGTAVSRLAGAYGDIQGDTTNDRATLNFINGASTGNLAWFLTFTYLIR